MAKTKKKTTPARRTASRARVLPEEPSSVYFLKLVLYLILGSIWLRLEVGGTYIPLPVGLLVGLIFASHEHFKLDKKIEYALLLVAAFVGFWLPLGIVVRV